MAKKKKDPSISFLNKWGYNVVKLPSAGIEPLDLIGVERSAQWLGTLSSVWTSKIPAPVPSPPRPASTVNGQKTDALELSLGLSVLANALSAFGAAVPSLDVAYSKASTVQFAYTNVTLTTVSPLDAGNYLAGGTFQTENPTVQNYFQNPDAKAYLITSVLRSDSISVTASDTHGTGVTVDVPAISGMVGAKVGVKPSSSSNSTVTFTGPQPVTFGFIVQQISYLDGKWSLRDAPASPDISFKAPGGAESHGKGVILTEDEDCRLDLVGPPPTASSE